MFVKALRNRTAMMLMALGREGHVDPETRTVTFARPPREGETVGVGYRMTGGPRNRKQRRAQASRQRQRDRN